MSIVKGKCKYCCKEIEDEESGFCSNQENSCWEGWCKLKIEEDNSKRKPKSCA